MPHSQRREILVIDTRDEEKLKEVDDNVFIRGFLTELDGRKVWVFPSTQVLIELRAQPAFKTALTEAYIARKRKRKRGETLTIPKKGLDDVFAQSLLFLFSDLVVSDPSESAGHDRPA